MAGLPVAALLAQLRAPCGDRLPEEVAQHVASFLPTGFDLLMPMYALGSKRPLAEHCAFLHAYITGVDANEDEEFSDDESHFKLEETSVIVMQLVGVRGPTARATMLSIFRPPVTVGRGRAQQLAGMGLRRLQYYIDRREGLVASMNTAELAADMGYLRELLSS
jgi:hypothetical protein